MFSKDSTPVVAGAALLVGTIGIAVASSDFRLAGIVAMTGGGIACVVGIIGALITTTRTSPRAGVAVADAKAARRVAAQSARSRPTTAREWTVRRRSLIPTR